MMTFASVPEIEVEAVWAISHALNSEPALGVCENGAI